MRNLTPILLILVLVSAPLMFSEPMIPSTTIQTENNIVPATPSQPSSFGGSSTPVAPVDYQVDTTPISQPIQTQSITSETHTPGRDSYVVDFGFEQTFTYNKYVPYDGSVFLFDYHMGLNATAKFGVILTLPVNITMTYNPTMEAGKPNNVQVDLIRDPSGASFEASYDFSLDADYQFPIIGSNAFELLNYQQSKVWNFETPLDPVPLTEYPIPLPLYLIPTIGPVIDSIFDMDLVLIPQLDAAINAMVYHDDPDTTISPTAVSFDTAGRKNLLIETDEFAPDQQNLAFGLTDFSMDFDLSLLWQLSIGFGGFIGSFISNKLKINMFTYPTLPLGGLLTSGITSGSHDLVGSNESPDFELDSYTLDDSNGNGILEPGETATVGLDLTNYGTGAAVTAGVYTQSADVTITETPSNGTRIRTGEGITHSLDISLAGGYSLRNATILITVDWLSTNGTVFSSRAILILRVLQLLDAYLKVDSFTVNEPNDGVWDPDETAYFDVNLSKVGLLEIGYSEIYVYPGLTGFTLDNYGSKSGPYTTWNATGLAATSTSFFTESRIDLYVVLFYNVTSSLQYTDIWIFSADINPPAPKEVVTALIPALSVGVNDGYFQAGEVFDVGANIENVGNYESGAVVGYLTSNSSDVIIADDYLVFNNHNPSETVGSVYTMEMAISEHAHNSTVLLTLTLYYLTPSGDLLSSSASYLMDIISYPAPDLSLNYYSVYNYDPSTLGLDQSDVPTAGYISVIYVNIGILDGPAYGGIATLSTDNVGIEVLNDTSYYGYLAAGDSADGDGFVIYVPANFAGGLVTFSVDVKVTSGYGEMQTRSGYFSIDIAAGDVVDPQGGVSYNPSALEGESIDFTIQCFDDVAMDEVYFLYYNQSSQIWIIQSSSWSATITYTMEMPAYDLYFAVVMFDTAGNYLSVGLDADLYVEYDNGITSTTDTSTTTSASSSSSSTTSTTSTSSTTSSSTSTSSTSSSSSSSSTTGSSTPVSSTSNGESTPASPSPVVWWAILSGLIVMPLVSRKRRE